MGALAPFSGPLCILEILQEMIHGDSWTALSVTVCFPHWPFLTFSPAAQAATAAGHASLGLLHSGWGFVMPKVLMSALKALPPLA